MFRILAWSVYLPVLAVWPFLSAMPAFSLAGEGLSQQSVVANALLLLSGFWLIAPVYLGYLFVRSSWPRTDVALPSLADWFWVRLRPSGPRSTFGIDDRPVANGAVSRHWGMNLRGAIDDAFDPLCDVVVAHLAFVRRDGALFFWLCGLVLNTYRRCRPILNPQSVPDLLPVGLSGGGIGGACDWPD